MTQLGGSSHWFGENLESRKIKIRKKRPGAGAPCKHIDDESNEDKDEQCVDVHVGGEGVEEGEEGGRGRARGDVQDGNT